ncbi:MAG TPA: amino acid ABC transporter substrate-binding protein [Thiotrichaceae bacterium]|nr:amino acid ABC transporter substrate-binding protein [Thiotrichaceae bacterium]
MFQFFSIFLLFNILLLISGCNDENGPFDNPFEPVKMGLLVPLTGTLAEKGKARYNAAQLAVQHLNEAGYRVELLVADSETNPTAATLAAQELVDNEGIQILIGSSASSVTIAVAEQVAIPRQIPQIAYSSTSPLITYLAADEGQDLLFRTVPPDTKQGIVLARLAYDMMGYQDVSILYINDAYGQGLTQVFTENFQALGGRISAAIPHNNELAPSYVAELQQSLTETAEALVVISFSGHARLYIKEAIEYDFFKQFLFVDGSKSEQLIEVVGAEVLEGLCGTNPSSSYSESLELFNTDYKMAYGESQVSFLANVYDAVIIGALAAYSVQANGEALTPLTIRDHLRKVANWPGKQVIAGIKNLKQGLKYLQQGLNINYVGASGNIDFDENGDVVTPIEIWCYQGGKIISQSLEVPCLLCGKK